MKSPPPEEPPVGTTELLVLPDGQLLVHNLTPALAAVLAELNPADEAMQERAAKTSRSKSRSKSRIRSRKTGEMSLMNSQPANSYERQIPSP